VREAKYGRIDGNTCVSNPTSVPQSCWVDVLQKMKTACDKKAICNQVQVTSTSLTGSDICSGTTKYLQGVYECVGGQVLPPTQNPTANPTPLKPIAPTTILSDACAAKTDSGTYDCQVYSTYCTSSTYTLWISRNCANFCCKSSLAASQSSQSSQSSSCANKKDRSSNCAVAGFSQYCTSGTYQGWMATECALLCCQTAAAAAAAPTAAGSQGGDQCSSLKNTHSNCGVSGYDQYCTASGYVAWMEKNCPKLCCEKKLQQSSPTAAAVAPAPAPAATTSVCASKTDVSPNCAAAGFSQYCNGSYKGWMDQNCAKLCCIETSPTPVSGSSSGSSGSSGSSSASAGSCASKVDKSSVCAAGGYKQYCNTYTTWMAQNCAKLCCVEPSPTPAAVAAPASDGCAGKTDKSTVCAAAGYDQFCNTYKSWMDTNCARLCCKGTAQDASAGSKCAGKTDVSANCRVAGYSQYCPTFKNWMDSNCSLLCCEAGY